MSAFDFARYLTPEVLAVALKPEVLVAVGFLSLVTSIGRYFTWCGVFYWIFYFRKRWADHKIQAGWPTKEQIANEVKWSLSSCIIYAFLAVFLFYAILKGWTAMYFDWTERGTGYAVLSFVLMIVVHDVYFYTTHRLSHEVRWVFRRVHRIHHQSTNPTPFADIMFHPVDALIHVGFLPVFIFSFPLHPVTLALFMTQVQAVNAIGHIGFELFPERWRHAKGWRWISRPTAHNIHHSHVHCNYGLYFRFLDHFLKTEKTIEDVRASAPRREKAS
jgi:lathosterol oxidase